MRVLLPVLVLGLATPAAAQDSLPKNPGKEALAVPPAASEAPAAAAAATADPALETVMDRIEARIALPAGSAAVAGHSRFYAWADRERTKVTAVYLAGQPARSWVTFDDLPDITLLRNGCGAVTLVYDVPTSQVDEIGCGPGA